MNNENRLLEKKEHHNVLHFFSEYVPKGLSVGLLEALLKAF